jgi:hypothetical protein
VSDPRLTVVISNSPTPCAATLTDTGGASQPPAGPITFQYNATDGFLTSNHDDGDGDDCAGPARGHRYHVPLVPVSGSSSPGRMGPVR